MIINSTTKTGTNDYLGNTQTVAMVYVERVVEASDTLNPFTVTIEGLHTVNAIIYSVKAASNGHLVTTPTYSISGNTITFTNKTGIFTNALGNIFKIYAFGV